MNIGGIFLIISIIINIIVCVLYFVIYKNNNPKIYYSILAISIIICILLGITLSNNRCMNVYLAENYQDNVFDGDDTGVYKKTTCR